MGEGSDVCLDETADCRPVSVYGKARYEAERLVLDTGQRGLSTTVLRLPMVYGPGCKGNLPRMIQAVARGRFPPLPEMGNRRSLVDVRDVVQAALLAATKPVAAGKVYIVTDGQAYSTRRMYELICASLQRPIPRWALPLSLLHAAASIGDMISYLSGKRFVIDSDSLQKLIGSAWYSSEKISTLQTKKVDTCYGDLVYVDKSDDRRIVRYWKSQPYRAGLFEKGWMPAHPTFYARKWLYDKYGGYDLVYRRQSDFELTMRFLAVYKIKSAYIPKVLVRMRCGGASQGIWHILEGNIEAYRACLKHSLNVGPFFIVKKIMSRIPQLFQRDYT